MYTCTVSRCACNINSIQWAMHDHCSVFSEQAKGVQCYHAMHDVFQTSSHYFLCTSVDDDQGFIERGGVALGSPTPNLSPPPPPPEFGEIFFNNSNMRVVCLVKGKYFQLNNLARPGARQKVSPPHQIFLYYTLMITYMCTFQGLVS